MLKLFVAAFFAFLCVGTVFSQTVPPVDGIYWDPSKGGRGYAVETQNNNMFVAIYDYDKDFSPTFYTIQANWDPSHHRVSNAELLQVVSGPWIGGPFSPVGQIVSKGPVTLEFPTSTTARFTFNGQTSNLQRFLFGYGPQANSLMQGLWHTTEGTTLTFGEMMVVTGKCTISSCATLSEPFVGNLNGLPAKVLVGSRMPDGRIAILVDSSTSYYDLYMFELRVNQWIGWDATFLKTQTTFPTSGLPMVADRVYGPAYVGSGTNLPKSQLMERDKLNELRAAAGSTSGEAKSLSAEEAGVFFALKGALSEMN